jgi:serine/threonine protein kinase
MGNKLLTLCPTDHDEDNFDNTYEVDEQNSIGAGKFAQVHLCWQRNRPEERYALKVINTKMNDMQSRKRIDEEINILKVLGSHPGIVSLVDVDETRPGAIRLVIELCEGGELYDRIQQKAYYPEQEAKLCIRQLLEAVAYIHSKGVMHRDLKPENILLSSKVSNTDVKISDFGLARISRDYPHRLPRSHSICGSDFYLAPEVIKQEEYGREIDIWALGVISYVLMSGSLPFFHNVLHKLYRQIVERDLSFPEQAWKNLSKGAHDFILRLMQVRAGDRLTADQALYHPWLRTAAGAASFSSFESPSNPNYFSMYGQQPSRLSRAPSELSQPNQPHPLEHARKVQNGGQAQQQQPPPAAQYGPPPGSPMVGGVPQYYGGRPPVPPGQLQYR